MAASYEKKFWLSFFELYKSLPSLWKINSEEYKDRAKKNEAYNVLVRKCKEIEPEADKDFVARKINSFRSTYRRELKKVNMKLNSGTDYEPSLWYFDKLNFLKNQEDPLEIDGSAVESENEQENENIEVQVPLKKKKHKPVNSDELLELATKRLKRCDDHSQTLANVWASEFRLASEDQKFYAKKAIDDILFEARLGTLHRNSVKINEDPKTFVTSDCTIETSRRTSSPIQTDCSDYTLNRSKRYSKHASASSLKRESYNASQRHYSESSLVEEIGIEADSD